MANLIGLGALLSGVGPGYQQGQLNQAEIEDRKARAALSRLAMEQQGQEVGGYRALGSILGMGGPQNPQAMPRPPMPMQPPMGPMPGPSAPGMMAPQPQLRPPPPQGTLPAGGATQQGFQGPPDQTVTPVGPQGGLTIDQIAGRIRAQNPKIDPLQLFYAVAAGEKLMAPDQRLLYQQIRGDVQIAIKEMGIEQQQRALEDKDKLAQLVDQRMRDLGAAKNATQITITGMQQAGATSREGMRQSGADTRQVTGHGFKMDEIGARGDIQTKLKEDDRKFKEAQAAASLAAKSASDEKKARIKGAQDAVTNKMAERASLYNAGKPDEAQKLDPEINKAIENLNAIAREKAEAPSGPSRPKDVPANATLHNGAWIWPKDQNNVTDNPDDWYSVPLNK